jgi:hypothetical protein
VQNRASVNMTFETRLPGLITVRALMCFQGIEWFLSDQESISERTMG